MRVKLYALTGLVLTLTAGATFAYTTVPTLTGCCAGGVCCPSGDCCPGSDCCLTGNCCSTGPCCPGDCCVAIGECCYPQGPCCDPGQRTTSSATVTKPVDCCAGSACCAGTADCCPTVSSRPTKK
jgi:hypothetical protein